MVKLKWLPMALAQSLRDEPYGKIATGMDRAMLILWMRNYPVWTVELSYFWLISSVNSRDRWGACVGT
jgi:hypothetical protein